MTAVLLTPPYIELQDDDGNPLSGGLVYTYDAGTNTPKATYTDSTEATQNANPVVLDAAGRAAIWINGSYKIVVKDSLGNTIRTTDNVAAFNTSGSSIDAILPTQTGNSGKALVTNGSTASWGYSAGTLRTEATVASASTTDIGAADGNVIAISGTTTITSLGSTASTTSPLYFVRFTGALTLTYNASSLILPSAANITTAAGDNAVFKYEGSGNWRCISYTRASGYTVVNPILTTTTYSITAGGLITAPHGLSYVPKLIVPKFNNVTTEAGWAVADKPLVPISSIVAGTTYTHGVYADSTNIYMRVSGAGIALSNKTSGVAAALTAANWQIFFEYQ